MSARRLLVRLGSLLGFILLFPLLQGAALAQDLGSGGPPLQLFERGDVGGPRWARPPLAG